jgi:hypothetical protein
MTTKTHPAHRQFDKITRITMLLCLVKGFVWAFSWSHFWLLKRMADGAVCWVADN